MLPCTLLRHIDNLVQKKKIYMYHIWAHHEQLENQKYKQQRSLIKVENSWFSVSPSHKSLWMQHIIIELHLQWNAKLTVPSSIFNNACCTPSPDTSLLMLRLSAWLMKMKWSYQVKKIHTSPSTKGGRERWIKEPRRTFLVILSTSSM